MATKHDPSTRVLRQSSRRHAIAAPGFWVALLLSGLLAPACTQPTATPEATPGPEEISQEISAKATVVSVDRGARLVGLQDKDGMRFTLLCGPEVRNFDQISVGDTVAVHYKESLAVALAQPGSAGTNVELAAGRAEKGATPAAAIGGQVTTTVRVESVDTQRNIVVFTPPGGGVRAVHVHRAEGQRFIRGLKPGDMVQITYTEAAAIWLEKQ